MRNTIATCVTALAVPGRAAAHQQKKECER
jgi:hypothetical protein